MKIEKRWCPRCIEETPHVNTICSWCCMMNKKEKAVEDKLEELHQLHPEVSEDDGN